MALSCKLGFARFSAELQLQDRAECGNRISGCYAFLDVAAGSLRFGDDMEGILGVFNIMKNYKLHTSMLMGWLYNAAKTIQTLTKFALHKISIFLKTFYFRTFYSPFNTSGKIGFYLQ